MIIIVRDVDSRNPVEFVIITQTTTNKEIEDIIQNVKNETIGWCWDDIVENLPNDCWIFDMKTSDKVALVEF